MDLLGLRESAYKYNQSYYSFGISLKNKIADEVSIAGLVIGHILEGIFAAPEQYPDIHVLWNLTVCWGCFCVYWGWLVWSLWNADVRFIVNRYWSEKRKVQ